MTVTSCGTGSTSRNQPTHPATASTRPRALRETVVSRPAHVRASPTARTSGQAVGAGSSISAASGRGDVVTGIGVCSAPNEVDHGEDDDPDDVDEVPVQSEHADAPRVLAGNVTGQSEERDDADQAQAHDDM